MTRCETSGSRSHSKFSFLSAAENVARQRQIERCALKKTEEDSRAVELALESHSLFISGCAAR